MPISRNAEEVTEGLNSATSRSLTGIPVVSSDVRTRVLHALEQSRIWRVNSNFELHALLTETGNEESLLDYEKRLKEAYSDLFADFRMMETDHETGAGAWPTVTPHECNPVLLTPTLSLAGQNISEGQFLEQYPDCSTLLYGHPERWPDIVKLVEQVGRKNDEAKCEFMEYLHGMTPLVDGYPERWEQLIALFFEMDRDSRYYIQELPEIAAYVLPRPHMWWGMMEILESAGGKKGSLLKDGFRSIVPFVDMFPERWNDIVLMAKHMKEKAHSFFVYAFPNCISLIRARPELWSDIVKLGMSEGIHSTWLYEAIIPRFFELDEECPGLWKAYMELGELAGDESGFVLVTGFEYLSKAFGIASPDAVIEMGKNLIELKRSSTLPAQELGNLLFRLGKFITFANHRKWFDYIRYISRSRSDMAIIMNLDKIDWMKGISEILEYCVTHKRKSLADIIQKLVTGSALGFSLHMRAVARIMDISDISSISLVEAKQRSVEMLDRILNATDFPNPEKKRRELSNFLGHVKSFGPNEIEHFQKICSDVVVAYVNRVYDAKFRARIIGALGHVEGLTAEKIMRPEFTEAFLMSIKPEYNKNQFEEILKCYLNGTLDSIRTFPENVEWLQRHGLTSDIWSRREREFSVETMQHSSSQRETDHFLRVANIKLRALGLEEQSTNGALVAFFDTTIKKQKDVIRAGFPGNDNDFENVFSDLSFQVKSLKEVSVQQKAKTVTRIKIYRETDPMRVLMMGNWVDGSCLWYYSSVKNYWSVATNALDANKAVFYIEDQTGSIIGRVLVAIDENKKLVRFPLYTKWNIQIDLNRYFNEYIVEFAEDMWFGKNGSVDRVARLCSMDWYEDPEEFIP